MAREWIKVGVAFLLLIGVTLYVSLHRKGMIEEAQRQDELAKLVQVDLSQVVRVDVVQGEEAFEFHRREKKDGKYLDRWSPLSDEFLHVSDWWIKKPVEALSDRNAIETLISHLDHLEQQKVIDETGEKAQDYGLSDPDVEVRLFLSSTGSPHQVIRVGAKNPSETALYIQTSASPKIVLAGMDLNYLRDRSLYDWRMKEVFGYKNKYHVKSLKVDWGKRTEGMSFHAKQENRQWFLISPQEIPAEDEELDKIASVLHGLGVKEFVSEQAGQEADRFGLDRPLMTVTIELEGDTETVSRVFSIGESRNHPDLLLRRADMPQIMAVERSIKDDFRKTLADLVTKRPYKIEMADVVGFKVRTKDRLVELVNTDGIWEMIEPVSDHVVSTEADRLLRKISGFKGKEFVATDGSKKGEPFLHVEITTEAGTHTTDLRETSAGEDLWMIAEKPNRTYRIAKEAVAEVFEMMDQLRERRWVPLALHELSTVQIHHGEKMLQFQPDDRGDWQSRKLENVSADIRKRLSSPEEIRILLNALRELRIDTFTSIDEAKDVVARWSVEFRPKQGEAMEWYVGPIKEDRGLIWSSVRNVGGWVPADKIQDLERRIGLNERKEEES